MNDFDDFDIGPQCDEYGDDYPYDDDEDFYGMPPPYASALDDDMPF